MKWKLLILGGLRPSKGQLMNKIINMNCLDFLEQLPNDYQVKCMFADIPDNIGLGYNSYPDKLTQGQYEIFIRTLLLEARSHCDIFWLSYNDIHDLWLKSMIHRDFDSHRWEGKNFIWRYTFSQYRDTDCAQGYRPILRLMRTGTKIYPGQIREPSKRMELGDSRAAGPRVPDNVWEFPRIVGNSKERRSWIPTQHPIDLMKRIINLSLTTGETIIDLFGGSGSCLRACLEINKYVLDRHCSIVELDPTYCAKISEETGVPIVSNIGQFLGIK